MPSRPPRPRSKPKLCNSRRSSIGQHDPNSSAGRARPACACVGDHILMRIRVAGVTELFGARCRLAGGRLPDTAFGSTDFLRHRLPHGGAMARNADGRAELQAAVIMPDQAEPFLAAVTALHDAAGLEGWRSTPSAQNSLQA